MTPQDIKTFGVYYHSARHQWQATYRTRVEPCAEFPRGVARIHIAFASSQAEAVVARDKWFDEVFGTLQPDGSKTGGLEIAWSLRLGAHRRESRKLVLERMLAGRGPIGEPSPSLNEPSPVVDEVKNVLDMLEHETQASSQAGADGVPAPPA